MKRILFLAVSALLIAACSSASVPGLTTEVTMTTPLTAPPTETPTPAATSTATPTATSAPTQTATPTETPEPTITPTPPPTRTPTPLPIFTLSGVVFFDYNGNGVRDEGEPPIPGATVQVGSLVTTAGADGVYVLERVPQGNQQVRLSAPGFRYVSLSLEAFQSSDRPVLLTIADNTQHDWGLMQGFLTLPYYRETPYNVGEYFDYDPEYGKYLWWNEQRGSGVSRNHVGTDLVVSTNGIPVVAPAPGRVIWLGVDPNGGWGIDAQAPDGTVWGVFHVTPTVSLNQTVNRGDLIGYVNFPGGPHVHLDVKLFKADGCYFRDIYVPPDPSICAEWKWAPNNDPIYLRANCSPGYWTVKNNPQFFD